MRFVIYFRQQIALSYFWEIMYPSHDDKRIGAEMHEVLRPGFPTMSKRDRNNRFADSPDFQELSPFGGEKSAASDVQGAAVPPKSIPAIVENEEEDEGNSFFRTFLGKISTFFTSSWKKTAALSVAATRIVVSKPWGWCRSFARWTWQFLRKIPSYCVIHWDSNETDDEEPETVANSKDLTKPTVKTEPGKAVVNAAITKPKTASAVEQYDDDEVVGSRWWGISIKAAAAVASLLILGGGYFAVKPMLFPATASDIETVALTDQTLPEDAEESTPETNTVVAASTVRPKNVPVQRIPEPAAAPAAARPAIAQAVPAAKQSIAFSEPSPQPDNGTSLAQAELEPTKESLLQDDLFASAPPAPATSENAADNTAADIVPPAFNDPFGAAPDAFAAPVASITETPAPAVTPSAPLNETANNTSKPTVQADAATAPQNAVNEKAAAKPLPALEPLAPLETAATTATPQTSLPSPLQSQLQPLAALDSSVPPSVLSATSQTAAVPSAMQSSASAPIAANFRDRRNARRTNANPSFDQAPSPPSVVSSITETSAPPAKIKEEVPIADPVKEIIPQIPQSGTVENVPPPVVAQITAQSVRDTSSAPTMPSESAPVIPKDAPPKTDNVISVPPVTESAAIDESVLPFLPINESPIDQSLRERLREQRGDDAETEPAALRFTAKAAAQEPALRFSPKKEAIPPAAPVTSPQINEGNVNEENLLMSESVKQFRDLLPTEASNALSPDSTDIAVTLPVLENAPAPVIAEVRPAYRGGQGTGEKGRTFQSRIDSEIKRSPTATETYIIQQGDTYMTISDRFYGTSLLYTALAAHNQKSGIGWRPAEGVVIEIPTAEYLRANYGDASQRQERRLEAQRSAIRYIVQEGDTIFRLATDKLQDTTRWREIYALNSDRIKDVRILQPGMEILLPAETIQ